MADWLIFITRGGDKLPSLQLVGAVFGVDVLATIFALFGWLSGPAPHGGWIDVVTVVRIYCYSIGVTVVMALVYYILNHLPFLDNLGRSRRGKKNKVIEDLITELQRLTIVHEEGGKLLCNRPPALYLCVLLTQARQQVKRVLMSTTTYTTSKRKSFTGDLASQRAASERLVIKTFSAEEKRPVEEGGRPGRTSRPPQPSLVVVYFFPSAFLSFYRHPFQRSHYFYSSFTLHYLIALPFLSHFSVLASTNVNYRQRMMVK
jgi:hypothetical protein